MMADAARMLMVCSCEDTMPLDGAALARGCKGGEIKTARHLCRTQTELFKTALGERAAITVGCTQEAPLFEEIAADLDYAGELTFANIRESAGWSREAAQAGPKMAALLAAAAEPMPPAAFTTLTSKGVALVYGRDETALSLGRRLAEHLDVTILLTRPGEITPPRIDDTPVLKGTITAATGWLGAFELKVDDYAAPAPSSRARLVFGEPRNGAISHCDIVIDVTGGTPLFPAGDLRAGYLRADPRDPAAIEKLIAEAGHLVGEFDKPTYVRLNEDLCAHARSQKTGCTRCLELCPTGAITPAGDHVAISAEICAGCGACASVCPTGAVTYALPPTDALLRRLRTLLTTYAEAGGHDAVVLLHDGEHGEDLIDALARFGDGLPARVLPLRVNEITQLGLESFAAALAFGASAIRVLGRARPKHDLSGLTRNLDYANALAGALGYGEARAGLIETDDPDQLAIALSQVTPGIASARPARFRPMGDGRPLLRQAIGELHAAAPAPVAAVAMPARAPFGTLHVETEGCTLCLACVSACPVQALGDDPERPTLTFQEDLCVQCGLCQATCPEKVITLEPRIDFEAWKGGKRIVKQEEPFHCISCAKPFGVRSTIEKIAAKLENKHWMFAGDSAKRISVIRMCEDCRVEAVVNESFDPHLSPQRPPVRTTEDYLRERKERGEDPLQ
jgi:ferredoxin